MPTVTVIIPTFNEVDYIKDALRSVQFADEIIIVDSFSKDGTQDIAKGFPTKILERKFDNFSAQKNFAIEQATSDWILFIDADERVTRSLEAEIKKTLGQPKHSGYNINFPHFFMTRFLYFQSNDVLRLVKREGAHFTGLVHEKLHCNGITISPKKKSTPGSRLSSDSKRKRKLPIFNFSLNLATVFSIRLLKEVVSETVFRALSWQRQTPMGCSPAM
jgi:glycosyltransferase involved in cell wall biosynthesis